MGAEDHGPSLASGAVPALAVTSVGAASVGAVTMARAWRWCVHGGTADTTLEPALRCVMLPARLLLTHASSSCLVERMPTNKIVFIVSYALQMHLARSICTHLPRAPRCCPSRQPPPGTRPP